MLGINYRVAFKSPYFLMLYYTMGIDTNDICNQIIYKAQVMAK